MRTPLPDVPTDRLVGESPLVDFAYQVIQQQRNEFSPLVIVASEDLEANRWLELACDSKAQHHRPTLWFRGREFARMVNHAHTTNAVSEFRDRIASAAFLVLEYPTDLGENSQAFHELYHLLEAPASSPPLMIFVLSQSPRLHTKLAPALSSRLSAGLQVQLEQPALRLKRHEFQTRLGPWLDQIPTGEWERWLAQPTPTWQAWNDSLLQLHERLRRGSSWPANQPAKPANQPAPVSITAKKIGQQVAKVAQVKWTDLKSASRRQSLVRARGVAIFLMREVTHDSFESIGRLLGNRDHSTVIHAYRKVQTTRGEDPDLEHLIQLSCQQLHVSVPNLSPGDGGSGPR